MEKKMLDESREAVLKEIKEGFPQTRTMDVRGEMLNSWPHRSICEVLREIYWATEDEAVQEKAVEAMMMAKRVVNKLIEYHAEWNAGHTEYMKYELISPEDQDRIIKEREEIQAARDEKSEELRARMRLLKDEQIKKKQKGTARRERNRKARERKLRGEE